MNTHFILSSISEAADTVSASGADSQMELGERISLGLEVTLLGMATVFGALIILWLILILSKYIFYRSSPKKQDGIDIPAKIDTNTASVDLIRDNQDSDELEIVAAITAAIAAASSDVCVGSETSYRVVSFRRIGKKPSNF